MLIREGKEALREAMGVSCWREERIAALEARRLGASPYRVISCTVHFVCYYDYNLSLFYIKSTVEYTQRFTGTFHAVMHNRHLLAILDHLCQLP